MSTAALEEPNLTDFLYSSPLNVFVLFLISVPAGIVNLLVTISSAAVPVGKSEILTS